MVDYCVYAWDSSSILEVEDDNFKKSDTFVKFYRDVKKIEKKRLVVREPSNKIQIVFVHWDEDLSRALEDRTKSEYLHQYNTRGEKKPDWLIRCLQDKYLVDSKNKIKLLYIITDGEISNVSLEKSIEMDEDQRYETVVFHALNKDPEKIDLSAAASFFKSRRIVYRKSEPCYSADNFKKFDDEKINADNFLADKSRLKSYIQLKFNNKLIPDARTLTLILKSVKDLCFPANLEATETNLPTPEIKITVFMKHDADSIDDYADTIDDDVDSMDDDADTIDDDVDSMDDDAESLDDDADDTEHNKIKIIGILLEYKEGMSIFEKYIDIMSG